ncbi:MAP3K12-binding inhibitory protein 1 [Chanos chanos]|uniref:MAP3K12-binding inhibitory protein 1 n=1 Tax=Chanos chanos TaxID=29144 RepID=A0A6J2WIX6_CHACN|nr:MAP3K12-binding inhibitory protein 1 [Chanos chanos]
MAATGETNGDCGPENKNEPGTEKNSAVRRDTTSLRDCFCALLNSLTDFGSELKVGADVLNISVNVSSADVSTLQPSHVYTCLQKHISRLQTLSVNVKQLVEAESQSMLAVAVTSTDQRKEMSVTSSEEGMVTGSERVPPTAHQSTAEEESHKTQPQVDDNIVQIKAGKSEIDRRISAFIERKQLEINENNVREFCNVIDCNQENSCARTDAVFTPYPGFKSHVKVTRVVNTYGPQTRGGRPETGEQQQQVTLNRDCGNPAIEERLHNIEAHLKLPAAGPVPQSVYQRLKKLEDRILELEGLSPEYFQSTNYLHKRPKPSVSQSYSLSELDGKISAVKNALLNRVSELRSTEAGDFPY